MALKKKKVKKASKKISKKPAKKKILKKKPLTRKKPAAKKKPAKKNLKTKKETNLIGIITHYFPHVQAAVFKVKKPLSVGDTVKIKGHTTDFTQSVASIQIERIIIQTAKKGDEIGLQVNSRVRGGDKVFKL